MKQEIVQQLTNIHQRDGGLTPPVVVAEARPEEAPLHSCFEWDDPIAGEQYRLMQARTLIRTVRIEIEGQPCNMFVHTVTEDNQPVYRLVTEVVKNPDMFARAIAELSAKLHAIARSIDELERLRPGALGSAAKHLAAASRAVNRAAAPPAAPQTAPPSAPPPTCAATPATPPSICSH